MEVDNNNGDDGSTCSYATPVATLNDTDDEMTNGGW
jgi:hypothetical protein